MVNSGEQNLFKDLEGKKVLLSKASDSKSLAVDKQCLL